MTAQQTLWPLYAGRDPREWGDLRAARAALGKAPKDEVRAACRRFVPRAPCRTRSEAIEALIGRAREAPFRKEEWDARRWRDEVRKLYPDVRLAWWLARMYVRSLIRQGYTCDDVDQEA